MLETLTLRKLRNAWVALCAISIGTACSNSGKNASNSSPSPNPPSGSPADSSADAKAITPPSSDVTSSRIIFSFKNFTKLKNLSAYVVDAIDSHGFKAFGTNQGQFALYSLKPGRYDIIVEAETNMDDGTQASSTPLGLRISGILIKAGEDTLLGEPLELLPSVPIKGKVKLFSGIVHGAIAVQIPGTRYKTTTEADGSFVFAAVAQGKHEILASNPGFISASYEARSWTTGSAELSPLTLLPDDQPLATGVHYKAPGLMPASGNVATLFLVRPAGMNKFRWCETSDFPDTPWQDFQSSLDLTFPNSNARKIFVQYSKDLQQFSATFSTDIPSLPAQP